MRLLLVAYFYEAPAGGGIIVARLLRENLEARGHTVDVLCLAGSQETQSGRIWRLAPPRWATGRIDRLRQILLFLNNRSFDRYFLRSALQFPLAQQGYDFVLAQDFLGLRVSQKLAQTLGIPCGATLHDTLPQQVDVGAPNPFIRRLLRSLSQRRDRSLAADLTRFDWLAAVSCHVRNSAERWLQPTPPTLHVVFNPIPAAFTLVPPPSVEPNLRFLFVGRLSPEKGIDLLVEAFRQTTGPQRLTILGLAGSLSGKVAALSAEDPRIKLQSAVSYSAMPGVYAAHHIVCSPVMWDEPFGLTVLEGRVTQRVVIGTQRGGLPEILEGYPRARLFEASPGDRAKTICRLVEAIEEAPDLVRTSLNPATEKAFLHRFQVSTVVDRYEELIRKAIHFARAPADHKSS